MKENKKKVNELPFDEELDIFGAHKSREQVRAEEKQRRKDERKALKEEIKRRRKDAKEGKITTRRKDIMVISAVLVGIILLCVLALFNSERKNKEEKAWKIDESRGHFVDEYATPTMTGTQLDAALREVYFTENGHLCVTLAIYNGTDKVRQIDALDAQGFDYTNYTTGEQFAGGKVVFEEKPVVKVAETKECTFYIAPEHILKGEDYKLPELVSFSIYFDDHVVEAE